MIWPVILKVPESVRCLKGKDQVRQLSRWARRALQLSAEKSGIELCSLDKDDNGAPLPSHGIYWSLTHKPEFVAGVAAPCPIGIDIEKIKPVSSAVHRRVAGNDEWDLGGRMDRKRLFIRYWTAKEAVLKAGGVGLRGLSACRVVRIVDEKVLMIEYKGQVRRVVQFECHGHLAAVVSCGQEVCWTLVTDLKI